VRVLPDGSIMAPHRGKPPACPDGFERDEGDPFIFWKCLPNCKYRERRLIKTGCCQSNRIFCKLPKPEKQVNRKTCDTCLQYQPIVG
jgi:hypothetical protein